MEEVKLELMLQTSRLKDERVKWKVGLEKIKLQGLTGIRKELAMTKEDTLEQIRAAKYENEGDLKYLSEKSVANIK